MRVLTGGATSVWSDAGGTAALATGALTAPGGIDDTGAWGWRGDTATAAGQRGVVGGAGQPGCGGHPGRRAAIVGSGMSVRVVPPVVLPRKRSRTWRAVGRRAGSLASIRCSSAERFGSMPTRSGSRVAMLIRTATDAPSPNGGRPVAA